MWGREPSRDLERHLARLHHQYAELLDGVDPVTERPRSLLGHIEPEQPADRVAEFLLVARARHDLDPRPLRRLLERLEEVDSVLLPRRDASDKVTKFGRPRGRRRVAQAPKLSL